MFSVASDCSSSSPAFLSSPAWLEEQGLFVCSGRGRHRSYREITLCFPYSIIGVNIGEKLKTECLKTQSAWEALKPKWVWWLNHLTIISLNCWARVRVTSLGTLHDKISILKLIFLSFPCRESVWDCISSRLAFNLQMFLTESCSSCSLCVSKSPAQGWRGKAPALRNLFCCETLYL